MNIDRIQSELVRLYGGRTQGTRGTRGPNATNSAGGDDQSGVRSTGDDFTLSSEASSARRLASVASAAPDVREQLVENLRSQVQAGTYQPNDEAVAQRLLQGE